MILTNPVLVSVIVLLVLCLLKVNVLLSLVFASLTAGVLGGLGLSNTMGIFIAGMGSSPETALSYVLLGGLAATISYTGISDILAVKIANLVSNKAVLFIFVLAGVSCLSQNLIPVHIAYIPILIPPLLVVMNRMKIDRRAVACALAFGLKAPYITIPAGFGLIYHGIIADNMTKNGMPLAKMDVWRYNWTIGVVMFIGLLIAVLVLYRKQRVYKDIAGFSIDLEQVDTTMTVKHYMAILAAVSTLIIQLVTGSLPLGALAGLTIMFISKAVKWADMDKIMDSGVALMGFIAFVMLVSDGFSTVLRETGAVDSLIAGSLQIIGGSQFVGALIMMTVGLFIVMGTGTSFGTVPVLAVLYVPLCASLGFSVGATTILLASAAAIGDAGSPVSDTTLGPTAGLNADGQHDHIWDTCVPTFIAFNIPIFIWAVFSHMLF